ncbi:MAG: hypothetical protein ABJR05_14575 [Balneola sp.]
MEQRERTITINNTSFSFNPYDLIELSSCLMTGFFERYAKRPTDSFSEWRISATFLKELAKVIADEAEPGDQLIKIQMESASICADFILERIEEVD